MSEERNFEHFGHWLFIQLSDGFLYKCEYMGLGKHCIEWSRVPEYLLFIHGEPVARFIIPHPSNKKKPIVYRPRN